MIGRIKVYSIVVLMGVLALISNTAGASVDIRDYDVIIRHDKPDSVYRVTCLMDIYKDAGMDTIQFYFSTYAAIDSVVFVSKQETIAASFGFEWRLLNVVLPSQLHGDSPVRLKFIYTLPGPAFSDNFILNQRQPWYPQISGDLASFKLRAIVDPEFITISNGDLTGVSDNKGLKEFVWESEVPIQKITLLFAQSNLYETAVHPCADSSVRIYLYSETLDETLRMDIAGQAAAMIDYYSQTIGSYLFRRLSIIETPNKPGGDVGPGLIFVGPDMIGRFIKGDYEELAAMVAMQWVGYGMYPAMRGPGAFFLGLSLPQHLKLMYVRHTQGETAFEHALQLLVEQYRTVDGHIDEPTLLDIDLPRSDVKTKVLIGKGPYVCELLRQELGEDNYLALIQNMYVDLKGRMFDYNDLEKYLLKIDPDSSGYNRLNKLMTETGLPK